MNEQPLQKLLAAVQPPALPSDAEQTIEGLERRASSLIVRDDEELKVADALRTEANRAITTVTAFWSPLTTAADGLHKMLTRARETTLARPRAVLGACDAVMKPYLRKRQEEAEAVQRRVQDERRREAEAERQKEVERIRRESEERARIAREEAAARAKAAEDEAIRQAEAEAAAGRKDAADAILEAGEQKAAALVEAGEADARLEVITGTAEAEEITAAPLTPAYVPPPPSAPLGMAPAKKMKANRLVPVNKRRFLIYLAKEVERGNLAVLSWFEPNFTQVDASVRQLRNLFPTFEECGIELTDDIQLRSSRK